MKRITLLVLVLYLLLGGMAEMAYASPADELIREQADHIDTGPVEIFWKKLMKEYGGYFPDSKAPTFLELLLPGSRAFSFSTLAKGMLRYFFHEILVNGKLLGTIVILSVFSAILETMQSAFQKNTVSKTAYAISFMVLVVLAINSFNVGIGYAKSAITGMVDFMLASVPLLMTMLASTGSIVSVSVLHPIIVFMIHTVSVAIYIVVFPLLFFSTVLHIVSSISERFKLTQLANLLRTIGVGFLGIIVTLFLGVISVQGATGAVTDGITVRTAKYVAGSFIPVVGRMFAETTDTVLGASLLIKNAVGLAGIVVIILLCAFPALKILTLALIYQLAAAIIQPIGESPIVTCLQRIGKNMLYLFAALAAVGLMFFLAITILITAGNVSVMMR